MAIYIFSRIVFTIVYILVCILIFGTLLTILLGDKIKVMILEYKMKQNINNEFNNEFELIYNRIVNSDLTRAQIEKNKNIAKCITNYIVFPVLLICAVLICIYFSKHIGIIIFVSILLFIFRSISVFYTQKNNVEYKEYIKKIVYLINPEIEYIYKNKSESLIYDDKLAIYNEVIFGDPVIATHYYITDSMKYRLDNNSKVLLENVQVKSGYRDGINEMFNGMVAKISRDKNLTTDILIKRVKLFKSIDRENNTAMEFDKYFYLSSSNDTSLLNNDIKEKLVDLYKKYKIMFEISLKDNNIHIRLFTGKMFEPNSFRKIPDKNRLYKEYVIFNSILDIIKEVNEIFN